MSNGDPFIEMIQAVVDVMPVENVTVLRKTPPPPHDPRAVAVYCIRTATREHEVYVALTMWADEPEIRAQQEIQFRTSIAAGIWQDLIDDQIPDPPAALEG